MGEAKVKRQVVEIGLDLQELQALALGERVEITPDHGDQLFVLRGVDL